MEQTIFTRAHDYLNRMNLEYEIIPAVCNIQAETYKFPNSDAALSGLSELMEMINDYNPQYVRVSLEITHAHFFVTLEEGDEEWDYGDEEVIDTWFSELDSCDLQKIFPDVFEKIMSSVDPECCTINDFIDEVDEMWKGYDYAQKYEIYQHFNI